MRAAGDDPRVGSHFREPPLIVTHAEAGDTRGVLLQRTRRTGFALACAMDHVVEGSARAGSAPPQTRTSSSATGATVRWEMTGEPGTFCCSHWMAA